MKKNLQDLLNAKGLVQLAFNQWYYDKNLPNGIVFDKKYFMVWKGRLTAFKVLTLVYAGGAESEQEKYSNKDGQYNKWWVHCNIAGVGETLVRQYDFPDFFLSIEEYDEYVKSGSKALVHKINNGGGGFTSYFCSALGCGHRDTNCWNHTTVMYYANEGSLTAEKTSVMITELYIDADGIHWKTNNKNIYGKDVFNTAQKAIEHAKVNIVVDFDDDKKVDLDIRGIVDDMFVQYGYEDLYNIVDADGKVVVEMYVCDRCDSSIVYDLSAVLTEITEKICEVLGVPASPNYYNIPRITTRDGKVLVEFVKEKYNLK